MHRSAEKTNSYFPLFDKSSSDHEILFRRNANGGLSIIQRRHEEIGETFIRNNTAKVCKSIIGLDANSLYGYALSGYFSTGPFLRQFVENPFKI